MLRIHFTAADVARVTIARPTTPLASEAVLSVQVLRDPPPPFRAWRRRVAPLLPPQSSLLRSLIPARGWIPDFLTPSRHALRGSGAFQEIRSTPRQRITEDLCRSAPGGNPPSWSRRLADGDPEAMDDLVGALTSYYDLAIAP
ncbi:hypothetical protein [Kitasatospora camelliae]|uniref:Uncharacterized protein n=1 Tax=Kitasatospora camelliae TaxID=3156397 RepID=A0AAU8K685_9ACTN